MPNISQKELMLVNDMVTRHQTVASKLNNYASDCTDFEVKNMLKKAATEAQTSAQNLISLL